MMTLYTSGTGGGSGNAANYYVWQERDPLTVSSYSAQVAMLYLTPIYIWDKAMGYKLFKTKDPMPPHAAYKIAIPTRLHLNAQESQVKRKSSVLLKNYQRRENSSQMRLCPQYLAHRKMKGQMRRRSKKLWSPF